MRSFNDLDYGTVVNNIRNELRNYLVKSRLKSLIIGVSGGLDSTACILLAKPVCKELGVQLIGRYIGIESNKPEEEQRAEGVGQFCDSYLSLNLTDTYNHIKYVADLESSTEPALKTESSKKIRHGNLKARLRMIVLYNLAAMYEGMVLSTDNYTEYLLGFWTLHGDVGDYGMIQSLWKTEVYNMVNWIAYNEGLSLSERDLIYEVLNANATDGLGITNTDLDQILPGWSGSSRIGYLEVDSILISHIDDNFTFNGDNPVVQRHKKSKFKRENPYNIPREKILKK